MLLFDKLNIYPFYGAIAATIIGYTISLTIPLINLKKEFKINFKETLNKLPKLFGVYIIMILLSLIYRGIINNVNSRILLIILLGIIGIILIVIYYLLSKKEIEQILGKSIKDIIRKKREK